VRLPKSGDLWPEAERKLWLGSGASAALFASAPSAPSSARRLSE
jgi:hypothetical protein